MKIKDKEVPNPGSNEARRIGCYCAAMDNGHGKGSGYPSEDGGPTFWIRGGCPVHDPDNAMQDKLD